MKLWTLLLAAMSLATAGCAGNRMLGCGNGCTEPCQVTRSQTAPRPWIQRKYCDERGGCAIAACDDTCTGGGCTSCDVGTGCASGYASANGCSSCGGAGCGACSGFVGAIASGFCPHHGGYPATPNFNAGPPTGQVAYPYYTVRGPRDFLQSNPPSIGPY